VEITIKIDPRKKEAKALLEFLRNLSFVEMEEKEKSVYDPKFVAMVKKSAATKKRYKVNDVDELWESL